MLIKIKIAKIIENELAVKNAEYEILQKKCNSLEEYKNNKETENMQNTINRALNDVSNILNASQMAPGEKI